MEKLISQNSYAQSLRAHLPKEAFEPDSSKISLLIINLLILVFGWIMGSQLHSWPKWWLLAFLPFALLMANSVTVLAFLCHDLMHGSVTRNSKLLHRLALIGQSVLWMPPTLWKIVHNRVHHNNTNMSGDPDRNYFFDEDKTIGKWIQLRIFPSSEIPLLMLPFGILSMWWLYAFRNIISALLWKGNAAALGPTTFKVSQRDRIAIAKELILILFLHICILYFLSFSLLQISLAYLLPLSLGYAGMMAYIFTNHLASPAVSLNDPLVNSISLKMPNFIDMIHLHFSYHAEHHIFPGLNSDYYPQVRQLLRKLYPDRTGYLISGKEAWVLLSSTPRQYRDSHTLVSRDGFDLYPCHLAVKQQDANVPQQAA